MTTRALIMLSLLLVSLGARRSNGDDNRPLYVELTEIGPGSYRIGMRMPPTIPPFNQPALILPPSCTERPGTSPEPSPHLRLDSGTTYRFYDCDQGLSGQTIEIRYPLTQVAVATVVRATFQGGRSHTTVLAPGENRWQIPKEETRSSVAADYLRLGIHHIWAGPDHLLFLLCLIYIAGSFGRILSTITGFTLAHSLTLALSALDVIRLPVPPIEAVIALSVIFLATEVSKGRRENLTWRYPFSISSVFGLLHGLGFAAALGEIGLPRTELATGLLFFNLGVEVGQLMFAILVVVALLAPLKQLARLYGNAERMERMEQRLQTATGYGVGCLAAFWMFERLAGFN